MKSLNIATIGSATIDLFFIGGKFTVKKNRLSLAFGGKYRSEDFAESLGGGGLNAAVGFSRLGLKTVYTGELSNDWLGNQIIERLKTEKVAVNFITQSQTKPSVSAILLGKNGERTIITYISPNKSHKLLTPTLRKAVKNSEWLFFCDHKSPRPQKLQVLKYASRNKTKIALSLSTEELKKGFLHNEEYIKISDVFLLNTHELADLTKRKYKDLDLKHTNYASILKTNLLIATDSKFGEYLYTKNKIIYREAYPSVHVIDATGAGDAFAVGFLYNYIKGRSFEESMDFGSKNSVSVIQKLGAQTGLLYA